MRDELIALVAFLNDLMGEDIAVNSMIDRLQAILDADASVTTRWDCIGPQTCTDCGEDFGKHQPTCPRLLARIEKEGE